MRSAFVPVGLAAVLLFTGRAGAAGAAAACTPRAVEKEGVRFVSVCPAGFFITATPLPCSSEEQKSAACDSVTALEASTLTGTSKNRHLDALVTDAVTAARLCKERFRGRLPTRDERADARRALGLATLQVREEPAPYARLRLDDMPEWVASGGRVTRDPEAVPRPRAAGETLLACVAEPAMAQAQWVPIGEACDERPEEAGVRSPNCAVGVPGTQARFELGCDPTHLVHSRARPEDAVVRCVVPERELAPAAQH